MVVADNLAAHALGVFFATSVMWKVFVDFVSVQKIN